LFVKDINANNPLCSGGKVVKAFADLVKVLWSHRRHAFKPSDLKVCLLEF
jgi:Ubiquitin C-terminal hydrolase